VRQWHPRLGTSTDEAIRIPILIVALQCSHQSNSLAFTALRSASRPGRWSLPLAPENPSILIDLDDLPTRSGGYRLQLTTLIESGLLVCADSQIDRDRILESFQRPEGTKIVITWQRVR